MEKDRKLLKEDAGRICSAWFSTRKWVAKPKSTKLFRNYNTSQRLKDKIRLSLLWLSTRAQQCLPLLFPSALVQPCLENSKTIPAASEPESFFSPKKPIPAWKFWVYICKLRSHSKKATTSGQIQKLSRLQKLILKLHLNTLECKE